MLTCNKVYSPSKVIGFNYFETMLLFLNKKFSYRYLTSQKVKHINFKEMTAIFQAITKRIEIFKCFHLYVFCNNFVVSYKIQKISIKREVMQLLRKIAMFSANHDIEVQAH